MFLNCNGAQIGAKCTDEEIERPPNGRCRNEWWHAGSMIRFKRTRAGNLDNQDYEPTSVSDPDLLVNRIKHKQC
uniref:Beta/gamma crystallin 'Greek key' domain-containing protein n=1 Tax=Ascaris lumbricoides TaxID=6252 RepID=A0A0M3I2Z4_ASCLU